MPNDPAPDERFQRDEYAAKCIDYHAAQLAAEDRIRVLEETLERATSLIERYCAAIVAASAALPSVNKVRLVFAGLDGDVLSTSVGSSDGANSDCELFPPPGDENYEK